MIAQRFRKSPSGFIVMLNRRVVSDAGINGVVKNYDVAMSIKESLSTAQPSSTVEVFGVYEMTK
jgi:hypothetical protein